MSPVVVDEPSPAALALGQRSHMPQLASEGSTMRNNWLWLGFITVRPFAGSVADRGNQQEAAADGWRPHAP